MPRAPRSVLALGLAAALALGAAGCGGEDAKLLPGETAREITVNLDTVKQLSDEGDCIGAESAARQVGEQIEAVEGVDQELKRALEEGADRLEEVIGECEESGEESVGPATVSPEAEEDEKSSKEKGRGKKEGSGDEGEAEGTPTTPASPALPPQAKGEGKGLEDGSGSPPEEEGESPSGGLSPGEPADEGE